MEEFRPFLLKHYLIFRVADEKFAIDILDVENIQSSKRKDILGDMDDLRVAVRMFKRLVPIINLRERLRLRGSEPMNPSLIFLKCKSDAHNPILGIQVDEALEIVETAVPKKTNGKGPRLIKALVGINQEVLMVLRIKDILNNNDELINAMSPALN